MTPFLFGKLPTHGDFISRGLDAAARHRWDEWASAGLEQAEAALGNAYEDAYAAAPPWRFVLATPGGWSAGAFACSVDRAGRRFPIVAGLQAEEGATADLEAAAEGAETAIYQAFGAGEGADALLQRLVGLMSASAPSAAPPRPRAWTLGGERHSPAGLDGAGLDPSLLVQALTPSTAAATAAEKAA